MTRLFTRPTTPQPEACRDRSPGCAGPVWLGGEPGGSPGLGGRVNLNYSHLSRGLQLGQIEIVSVLLVFVFCNALRLGAVGRSIAGSNCVSGVAGSAPGEVFMC